MPKAIRYMAFDPAERTHAFSVFDITLSTKLKVKCIASGMIDPQATIVNLTHKDGATFGQFIQRSVEVEFRAYDRLMGSLIKRWQPQRLGTERFQVRGTSNGKTIETVGMMNALILRHAQQQSVAWTLYLPVTWKSWVNRILTPPAATRHGKAVKVKQTNIDTAYRVGEFHGLTHHSIDTALMCLWLASQDHPEAAHLFTEAALLNVVRNLRVT